MGRVEARTPLEGLKPTLSGGVRVGPFEGDGKLKPSPPQGESEPSAAKADFGRDAGGTVETVP